MCAKQSDSEGDSLRYQLSDSADSFRADSSAFGMGSFSDFDRHLVLPLQSRFQERLPGDADSGHDNRTAGKSPVYLTLHDELRDYVLELAAALGYTYGKSLLLADTLCAYYKKYFSWMANRARDNNQ